MKQQVMNLKPHVIEDRERSDNMFHFGQRTRMNNNPQFPPVVWKGIVRNNPLFHHTSDIVPLIRDQPEKFLIKSLRQIDINHITIHNKFLYSIVFQQINGWYYTLHCIKKYQSNNFLVHLFSFTNFKKVAALFLKPHP